MSEPKFKAAANSVMTPTTNIKRKDVLVKVPALMGEIVEVSWDTSIKAAREKSAITAPHWKKGDKVEEDNQTDVQRYPTGSKRPGVYLVKNKKGPDTLTVKVNITKSEGQDPEAKLFAFFSGLRLEGKCPTGLGAHDVKVTINELPDTLQHYEGDVSWGLETSKMSLPLANKTRLELFVILDKPATFYKEGVWVEALRFVFKRAKVGGTTNEPQVADRVSKHCHTHHGVRYDTYQGSAQFGGRALGDAPFQLMKYMNWKLHPLTRPNIYGDLMNNIVNCYDQAAAVQALAGSVGAKTQWVFFNPYGFIRTANLVGVGNCNNPFFKNPQCAPNPVVDPSNSKRSPFGNHAFLQIGSKTGNVLDACAGPHTGTEDMTNYVKNVIDSERSVTVSYFVDGVEIRTGTRPGNAADYGRLTASDTFPARPAGLPSVT